jgi:hypothetical protein
MLLKSGIMKQFFEYIDKNSEEKTTNSSPYQFVQLLGMVISITGYL